MGVVYFSIIPTFEPSRYYKCWIVCFYYIKTFGASEVVLLNGEVLPVSIEYKNEAMKFYMDMAE